VIVTGPKVAKFAQEKEDYLYQIAKKLDAAPAQVLQKVEKIQKEFQTSSEEVKQLKHALLE
jgi:alanyl-tRNA synthetase